jgi:hypothetical protein
MKLYISIFLSFIGMLDNAVLAGAISDSEPTPSLGLSFSAQGTELNGRIEIKLTSESGAIASVFAVHESVTTIYGVQSRFSIYPFDSRVRERQTHCVWTDLVGLSLFLPNPQEIPITVNSITISGENGDVLIKHNNSVSRYKEGNLVDVKWLNGSTLTTKRGQGSISVTIDGFTMSLSELSAERARSLLFDDKPSAKFYYSSKGQMSRISVGNEYVDLEYSKEGQLEKVYRGKILAFSLSTSKPPFMRYQSWSRKELIWSVCSHK